MTHTKHTLIQTSRLSILQYISLMLRIAWWLAPDIFVFNEGWHCIDRITMAKASVNHQPARQKQQKLLFTSSLDVWTIILWPLPLPKNCRWANLNLLLDRDMWFMCLNSECSKRNEKRNKCLKKSLHTNMCKCHVTH